LLGDTELKAMIESYMQRSTDISGKLIAWFCQACDKTTTTKTHMVDHVESKHIEGLSLSCPYCASMFGSRGKLRIHVSNKHREEHQLAGLKLY
jgi:hypothetical protein